MNENIYAQYIDTITTTANTAFEFIHININFTNIFLPIFFQNTKNKKKKKDYNIMFNKLFDN